MGFGQEIMELASIEVYFTHVIWSSALVLFLEVESKTVHCVLKIHEKIFQEMNKNGLNLMYIKIASWCLSEFKLTDENECRKFYECLSLSYMLLVLNMKINL